MKVALCCWFALLSFALAEEASEPEEVVRGHVFAWPFVEAKEMQPRGGTTRGTEVTLAKGLSPEWEALQAVEAPGFEKDLAAILALAGSYRVSFDFIETMGFQADYTPPKPYFSWATEHVHVLEKGDRFVSLQHSLVMYFKDKEGKETGPMVMKHWRQDWTYEDTDLHTYQGNLTWERETRPEDAVRGAWTQAVYQVDDSPRYEVVGRWSHDGGVSTWKSDNSWRPLPRREFSVRDDYDVLQGTHEITITPNGWVHTQRNEKLAKREGAEKIVAHELGVNRYERITEPALSAGLETFEKVAPYWQEVRERWAEIFVEKDSFSLKSKLDEQKLYQIHFGYAGELATSEEPYDAEAGRKHARETIAKFLREDGPEEGAKY